MREYDKVIRYSVIAIALGAFTIGLSIGTCGIIYVSNKMNKEKKEIQLQLQQYRCKYPDELD